MNDQTTTTKLLLTGLAGLLVGLGVFLWPGGDAKPGTRSSGDPSDADYCNVLLEPSIAQHIGLELPDRIRVAAKGAGLLHSLTHNPLLAHASEPANKSGQSTVERYGKQAKQMLPPLARSRFAKLFDDGKLIHVGFWMEKKAQGFPGNDPMFVTWGWYEAEKNRASRKSMTGALRDLKNRWRWFADDIEAEMHLEHADEAVRRAAQKYLDRSEADWLEAAADDPADDPIGTPRRSPPVRPSGSSLGAQHADAKAAFERSFAETKARMEEKRREMAAKRAAHKERVRKHQEEVERRLREARGER